MNSILYIVCKAKGLTERQLSRILEVDEKTYMEIENELRLSQEFYSAKNNVFALVRLEGTVLNPGLSIGVETFIRGGEAPLFNVSLTKVIDLKQLGSLFTKVSTSLVN